MENKTMDLAPIKRQVSSAVAKANALQIKTKEDLVKATDISNKINSIKKVVDERMKAPITAAYQAYKKIMEEQRKTFGSFVNDCISANKIIDSKMIEFHDKEEEKARIKEEKIAEKVENGKMKMDKVADKIEEIQPEKKIEVRGGSAQIKIRKKAVIENPELIAKEVIKTGDFKYFLLNETLVKKDALAGVKIPGVKVVEEKEIARRSY